MNAISGMRRSATGAATLTLIASGMIATAGTAKADNTSSVGKGTTCADTSAVAGSISRCQILGRANYWVNGSSTVGASTTALADGTATPVAYSQSTYHPDPQGKSYRSDCSGFAGMAWHLSGSPIAGDPTSSYNSGSTDFVIGDGTSNQKTVNIADTAISKSQLLPGDVVTYYYPIPGSAPEGHVVIFDGWKDSSQSSFYAYEETTYNDTAHLEGQSGEDEGWGTIPWPYYNDLGAASHGQTLTVGEYRYNNLSDGGPPPAPTVAAQGSIASGTLNLLASDTDSSTTSVTFKVDGTTLGTATNGPNFSLPWDTTKVLDGTHQITAYATNAQGNSTSSASAPFSITNDWLAQLHNNGSIFQHNGGANTTWSQIGNNVASKQIATSNDGTTLYELDTTGSIWKWTAAGGWSASPIDTNAATIQVAANNSAMYQLHSNGAIYQYTPGVNANWTQVGNNVAAKAIAAGNDGSMYELDSTGTIWQYKAGTWTELDNNTATVGVTAGDASGSVWEQHSDGSIWQYTGTPMTGWTQVGNNVATTRIVAAPQAGTVYELDNTGTIWRYAGGTWSQLDTNTGTTAIQVGDGGTLYQLHGNGAIYQYTPGVNANWTQLDSNTATTAISSGATRSAHL